MKNLVKIIIIIGFSFSLFSQNDPQQLFSQANTYYQNKEYTKAIELYDRSIKENNISSEIYFNLGNSHYRLRHVPESVYNFELAKKLNPDDEEIDYNLRIANLRVIDKFDQMPRFFLAEWYSTIIEIFSSNRWALISLICFWGTFICLAGFLIIWKVTIKKILFAFAIFVFIFSIATLIFSFNRLSIENSHDEAIIFSQTVYAKSSPDKASTDLFILHEGTKIKITDQLGDWVKIKLANGTVGWMPKASMKVI